MHRSACPAGEKFYELFWRNQELCTLISKSSRPLVSTSCKHCEAVRRKGTDGELSASMRWHCIVPFLYQWISTVRCAVRLSLLNRRNALKERVHVVLPAFWKAQFGAISSLQDIKPISAQPELLQHILLPFTGALDHLANNGGSSQRARAHIACFL